ncbi:MAG: glycosyltransferase family 2 protein [Bariatricus sp.]
MNPTVSIIVPVYNAEATISRCIESIINQEYRDFELLLIDDGSTDSSGTICDRYAAEDSRIRLIHKENTGVSETRNMALDLACGTYLQFLDSDDWITPNATRLFVEEAERYHCDMVISDFYRVVGKRVAQKGDIDDDCVLTQEEFSAHMLQNPADFYYGVLWNKLYRRDIVEKYHLRMNPEISWCEDFMFNLEYIRHAEVFYALQVPIYYYVKTKGSLASQGMSISKTIKMKLMVFEYYNNFYKHVLDEEDYEKNRLQVYRFLVDAAGDGAVPPSFFSGSKKLGEERNRVSQEVVAGEGILMDDYRSRKLLDYYLEPIAQKNSLTLNEVRLLLYLSQLRHIGTRKEMADFAGITVRSLSLLLQRLSLKNMLKYEENRTTKELKITFLPLAAPIQNEIAAAQGNFEQAKYAGFTEDELIQYAALTEKIKNNIQKIL